MSTSIEYTSLGPKAPDTDEVLADMEAVWQAAFDNKLNTDAATPQGQLITSLTAMVQNKNNELVHLANQFNPLTAEGIWQDALAAIYFLTRNAAQPTVVQVVCSGLAGTVIAGMDTSVDPATVRTSDGYELICQTTGTIGEDGTVTLPFECTEVGAIEIEANSVTTIVKAQSGWDSVDNPDPGAVGNDVETQQAFENRRYASVALNSRSMLASVYSRVGEVDGVIDLLARQNRTDVSVVDNGVTYGPHSIYICVLGGADADIAEAIYNSVSAGCDYNGNTSYEYTDPVTGAVETVLFQRPEAVEFQIVVTIQANSQSTDNTLSDAIKENIYADFYGDEYPNADTGVAHNTNVTRITIGSTTYASRFYCPVMCAGASTNLVSVEIGRKDGELTNVVSLTNAEYPSLTMDDITVNILE